MNDLKCIRFRSSCKNYFRVSKINGDRGKRIMASKRFKKLPEKTSDLPSEAIDKLIPEVKKNCTTKFDESIDLSFQINNKQKKVKLI